MDKIVTVSSVLALAEMLDEVAVIEMPVLPIVVDSVDAELQTAPEQLEIVSMVED